MRKRKLYIEFVGQHTAGKTSTIREVVDKNLLSPLVAVYPQQIKRSNVHFLLSVPILFLANLHHIFFVSWFFVRYTKLNWINYHAVKRHIYKMVLLHPYYERYPFDVWMKDDMLHLLPRLDFRQGVDVKGALQTFFNHFSHRYDGLVYIDLSHEVMHDRFERRFETRAASRKESRGPVYERSFEQTLLLKEILETQDSIPVLVLDGTKEIHDNAARVAGFVKTKICVE